MSCYCCSKDNEQTSVFELKSGGNVDVCLVCENTYEYYLDYIKRNCLIDGVAYGLSKQDESDIKREQKLRKQQEHEEAEYERLVDSKGSIFYFTNEQKKNVEMNHHVIQYAEEFTGSNSDDAKLMRFNYPVQQSWFLEEWDGLRNCNVYLDDYNLEVQRVKKSDEKEYRERRRYWYRGRFECDNDLYNTTFGYALYDNDKTIDRVYLNYQYICSKSYRLEKLIKYLVSGDCDKKKL